MLSNTLKGLDSSVNIVDECIERYSPSIRQEAWKALRRGASSRRLHNELPARDPTLACSMHVLTGIESLIEPQ